MLRLFSNNLKQKWCKISSSSILQTRNLNDKTQKLTFGGGLEKPQGGLKEEKYFCTQNYDLMAKIREQGSKLKCENCIGDWREFEKFLDSSNDRRALRETCSANKHKNCLEEAFFLDEQNECCNRLRKENKLLKHDEKETNMNSVHHTKKIQNNENEEEMV